MKLLKTASFIALACSSTLVSAQDIQVEITNLTNGIYYTPLLVAAHPDNMSLYTVGTEASEALQKMAEGGQIADLETMLSEASANIVANPAMGLLAPGHSTTAALSTDEANTVLSVVGMLLPTNDGFVGLRNWTIPTEPGTYTINVNAYDAGTEANNELVVDGSGAPGTPGIPAAPGMDSGTGGTSVTSEESNQTVHVHRGNLGDDNATGGKSDLDNTVHRWLNPVARITVTVQ